MSQVLKSQPSAGKAAERERARRIPGPASQVAPSSPLPLQTLLYLQKFAGNAAVAEMLNPATERQELPQRQEPLSPAAGAASPPTAANGASPAASANGPAGAAAPSAMALLGEVAGVAMPIVGAVASPFAGIIGSLLGSAVAPAPQQANGREPAQPQAAGQKAAAGQPHAEQQPGAESGAAPGATGVGSALGSAVAPAQPQAAGQKGAADQPYAEQQPGAESGAAPTATAVGPLGPASGSAPPQGKGQAAGQPQAASQSGSADKPHAAQQPAAGSGAAQQPTAESGAAPTATAVDGAAPATGPATATQPPTPATDPNFLAVKNRVHTNAAQSRQHPPAHAKVAEAQSAARGPTNEVASQAGAAQVEKMSAQQPGGFDKKAFMDAVRKAIDAAAPHSLEEADDFKDSGKAGQIQGQVSGLVGQNKQAAAQGIKGATEATPDTSAAQPKPVTPMPAEQPGSPPALVGAAAAMPSPKPADDVSLAKGPAEVNASMQEADVTEDQLKESNEPEFTGALDAKQVAEKHSEEAPQAFRQQEQGVLEKAHGSASASADQGMQAMHGDRAKVLNAVATGKGHAKTQDEARRAEVSSKIEGLYGKTKDQVTGILNGIDPQVDAAFKDGEGKARTAFESYVDTRVSAYKDDRYSGLRGKWRWIKDKFKGLPGEVNQFYAQGRELYLSRMEGVIGNVADIVGRELTRAKDRIAFGQTQIQQYVASLPADLQKVGQEAQQNIQTKFNELTQSVDSKQEELVDTLAKKYVESRDAVDARIKEMKDANKGLIDRAKDAVMGVINTIRHLKDMLLGVLAKVAGVVGSIISAPIKFLGNLVSGIKQGLTQFMSNIGEHLKKGLLGWLFGALGEAGLQLPEKFDLKGILSIIMQVLGLTYSHIRGLAVGIVGEEVVAHLEKSLTFFQVLIKEGPAGLWNWIVEKLSELKETVMTKIKEFIQEKVIIAGIMWLIGLLNPVAAFIKACKAIYDIVMFFIDRAQQVGELVNAIVDSVGAIAGGALGEAAGKVENALAKGIPVAIGFLASLLGLGGISDKIKSIIHAIQEPIHNVISKVLGVVLKPFKWIGNKIKSGAAWAKKKLTQGVAFVKTKAKQGVAWVKGKIQGVGKKEQPTDQAEQARRDALKEKAIADVHDKAQGVHQPDELDQVVASVFAAHQPDGLLSLEAHGSPEAGSMVVSAEASKAKKATVPVTIKVSQKEYERMLGGSAFVEHQLDPTLASVDAIGEAAADLAAHSYLGATKTKVWDDAIRSQIVERSSNFVGFVRKGNWTSAGTLFHSIAKLYVQDVVSRSGGDLPGSAQHMEAEYTVRRGKGGSRLDFFIIDGKGKKHEIDWKTTGKSALTAETEHGEFSKHERQAKRHKGEDNTLDQLSSQASRSWTDYIRPHLAAELEALNAKVRDIEGKIEEAKKNGKKARLTANEKETLTIAQAWADRGFFSKRQVEAASADRAGRIAAVIGSGATPRTDGARALRVSARLSVAGNVAEERGLSGSARADSVKGSLQFGSAVARGGVTVPGNAFGVEMPTFKVDSINWTIATAAPNTLNLHGRVFVDCKWDVHSLGRTDIPGAAAPAVTDKTWKTIHDDLKPDGSGRPNRNHYWAEDITSRHERFHATDDIGRARLYVPAAQAWLDSQSVSATNIDKDVAALMRTVQQNVQADAEAYYQAGGETRAYADGKQIYQTRVDDVRDRAVKEGWK